jgi:cytosine/adenosine deaminase-related metal-dependent hydrolase
MRQSLLLRGGTVVSCDPRRPPHEQADILIEGDLIRDIAPHITLADAHVVDLAGKLVLPGFVDAHRHCWQTGIRGVAADWSLVEYVKYIRLGYALAYRAEDVEVSNLVGLLEALDAGITSVCDFSHIMNSPQHADAAADGFTQAGLRGSFCYGFYDVPCKPRVFADHAARLRDAERALGRAQQRFGTLARFGVALTEYGLAGLEVARAEIGFARANGLPITMHMGTLSTPDAVAQLDRAGLLGPDMLHVHCNFSSDEELQRIADTGGTVVVTPETELQMAMGFPVTGRLLKLGIAPSLGIDIVSDYAGDMFGQMRLALQTERALRNQPVLDTRKMPPTVSPTVRDALNFATLNGARAMGLESVTGSLVPGKQADIIAIATTGFNFMPPAEPIPAIVLQARASDVSDVWIAGVQRKRDGKLVGVDVEALRRRIAASQQHLLEAARSAIGEDLPTSAAYRNAISQIT